VPEANMVHNEQPANKHIGPLLNSLGFLGKSKALICVSKIKTFDIIEPSILSNFVIMQLQQPTKDRILGFKSGLGVGLSKLIQIVAVTEAVVGIKILCKGR
jgi:hypothetical protein